MTEREASGQGDAIGCGELGDDHETLTPRWLVMSNTPARRRPLVEIRQAAFLVSQSGDAKVMGNALCTTRGVSGQSSVEKPVDMAVDNDFVSMAMSVMFVGIL